MNEREKQLAGEFYNPLMPEVSDLQDKSRILMREYNAQTDKDKQFEIMKNWFGKVGENCYIEPNFFCDFGCNLFLGKNVYFNTNCVVLDSGTVTIGDSTFIGSNVQICTPTHPLEPEQRRLGIEKANPINIGSDCWIGSSAVILGGVTIGDGTTIGAGSIVTRNVPPRCIAVGNPCKVIKRLK